MNAVVPGATAPAAPTRGRQVVLALRGVGKTYTSGALEVEALRDVSLDIRSGEYVAITGPSGSGKSTLMHILGCLDIPTTGTYLLAGDDVSHMGEAQLAHIRNRRIGFIFQRFHLMAELSALRNVELPLMYAEVPRDQRRERAISALSRVGLADRVDHRPGELSGGQQQRVAVARALVTNPDLILADEPTGNLDSAASADVLELLDEVNAAGNTVVLITHEAEVAARTGRIIHVLDGNVLDGNDPQSSDLVTNASIKFGKSAWGESK